MSKDMMTCQVCGWHDHWQRFDGGYCPNCGAFVTDEDDVDAAGGVMNETQVKIAAKLYECRDAIKSLYGAAYSARMAQLARIIELRAKQDGTSNLAAATSIAKESGTESAVTILAAFVEMTEPSVAPTRRGRRGDD